MAAATSFLMTAATRRMVAWLSSFAAQLPARQCTAAAQSVLSCVWTAGLPLHHAGLGLLGSPGIIVHAAQPSVPHDKIYTLYMCELLLLCVCALLLLAYVLCCCALLLFTDDWGHD
jgi:hypothetical protein